MGILDEENPSLWIGTSEATSYKPLPRPIDVDAVVIGAGITGLTTALLLRQEGLKVAVLEAGRVASGVTGYTTAKVTALHGLIYQELMEQHGQERTVAYAAANAAAVDRIRAIADREGIDCDLVRADAYTYAETMDGAEAGPEQAAFVEIDGETVAVYRDERGRLHALSADCTHMGCRVAFNPTERTWDCPCHGTRFDPDGRVIHGPANQDLERKEIPEPARR